jgi:FkbM family methyltransferase
MDLAKRTERRNVSLLGSLIEIARGLRLALRTDEPLTERLRLAAIHSRLQIRIALGRTQGVGCESFFGWTVRFFDYKTLVALFQEIFLAAPYRLPVKSSRPTIVDCGANIGLSVLYFKRRFPRARIIAFEPDPEAFKLLKENVLGNRLNHVELHEAAVGRSEGEVDFYSDTHLRGSLHASMIAKESLQAQRTVRMVRLSTFITDAVDILKLDIQGAEGFVIEDLIGTSALRSVRALIMEYHHHLDPGIPTLGSVLRQLEESGFEYQIATSNYHAVLPRQSAQDVMVYAYPK